jgi:translation elongation factor EF-Ts
MAEKIAIGKVNKFFKENTFIGSGFLLKTTANLLPTT